MRISRNQMGIVALILLTCMIGVAYVSAAKDNPNQPWNQLLGIFITNTETDPIPVAIEGTITLDGPPGGSTGPDVKYVQIQHFGSDVDVIDVDLEGYKDLQVTWNYYTPDPMDTDFRLFWCQKDGIWTHEVYEFLTWDTTSAGSQSFKVASKFLRIYIDSIDDTVIFDLILYATK